VPPRLNLRNSPPVPRRWRREIERILLTEKQIARRVQELARQIERDFRERDMVIVSLLNGTVLFLADLIGRDVLLVDDVLDTGRTMSCGLAKMRAFKPRRVKTCVLLDKPARRVEKIRADYVGFEIPDVFVVGYGLDWAERYRHLPFIGVLRPHLCR
jgi:hypoxanthine phosphoribosyltransferase